jgi:hypothetical protein
MALRALSIQAGWFLNNPNKAAPIPYRATKKVIINAPYPRLAIIAYSNKKK